MPFIINQTYSDDWAELTEPSTIIEKLFTLPVDPEGVYSIEIVYSAQGRYILYVVNPDGDETAFSVSSSAGTERDFDLLNVNQTYAGIGTQWGLRCKRYTSVNDNPLPKYKLHNVTVVDSSDNTQYDTIADKKEISLLPTLWHTYKSGTVMFEIPSSGTGSETPIEPDPTHYHYISGNVKKLDLPFEANVVATSIGLEPVVLGAVKSNKSTGDYIIDVYPYSDEVIIYIAPDYGVPYVPSFPMATGQIVHPTVPNKYVYVAQSDGALGINEPNWPTEGNFNSGTVTLTPVPLYRPLANGFVKPTIVPI